MAQNVLQTTGNAHESLRMTKLKIYICIGSAGRLNAKAGIPSSFFKQLEMTEHITVTCSFETCVTMLPRWP